MKSRASYLDILTPEFLTEIYINQEKTQREVAEIVGCSVGVVDKYIRKYKIFKHPHRQNKTNKSVDHVLTYEYLKSVHEDLEVKEIAEEVKVAPSTVRKYLHKYGLSIKDSRVGKVAGEKNPNWRGGKYYRNGYKMLRVGADEYVREHMHIMEQHLGRKLREDEVVHHLNGKRRDNRIENLLLLTKEQHDFYHKLCKYLGIDYTKHTKDDVLNLLREVENVCRPYRK